MPESPLIPAKQEILDRVRAALEFCPDDPDQAEKDKPWLVTVLNLALTGLTYRDLSVWQVNALNALLGPTLSLVLGGGNGDGPTEGTVHNVPHLCRAV